MRFYVVILICLALVSGCANVKKIGGGVFDPYPKEQGKYFIDLGNGNYTEFDSIATSKQAAMDFMVSGYAATKDFPQTKLFSQKIKVCYRFRDGEETKASDYYNAINMAYLNGLEYKKDWREDDAAFKIDRCKNIPSVSGIKNGVVFMEFDVPCRAQGFILFIGEVGFLTDWPPNTMAVLSM